MMENDTETVVDPKTKKLVEQPDYVIDMIRRSGNDWYLARKMIFDRDHLVPHRQIIYDDNGERRHRSHLSGITKTMTASGSPTSSRSTVRRRSTPSS